MSCHRILKKIEADSPITAIDFTPDGTSLLVGTNRGRVLMYDLRSISAPVHSFVAHSTAVTKLICRYRNQNQVIVKSFIGIHVAKFYSPWRNLYEGRNKIICARLDYVNKKFFPLSYLGLISG